MKSYFSSFPSEFEGGAATVRAGNVFGGGDWSKYRLIPEIVESLSSGTTPSLRMPFATRPWTHVTDVLHGYLRLASSLRLQSVPSLEAWNFASGELLTVGEVSSVFMRAYGVSEEVEVISEPGTFQEAELLQISPQKSMELLNWQPLMDLRRSLEWTANWYRMQSTNRSVSLMSQELVRNTMRI